MAVLGLPIFFGLASLSHADEGYSHENLCDSQDRAQGVFTTDADVVFFGELHGNQESPQTFFAIVCEHLRSDKREIRVALELPSSIQTSLDRFLDASGEQDAFRPIVNHPFWQRSQHRQDGRSSAAMLRLVDSFRILRAATKKLASVTAFDGIVPPNVTRAAAMAGRINRLSQESNNDVVLVLTGSFHARRTPQQGTRSHLTPAASLVKARVLSVLLLPESGESWNCQPNCQTWPVRPVTDLSNFENKVVAEGSYDYVLPLGHVTASPPPIYGGVR